MYTSAVVFTALLAKLTIADFEHVRSFLTAVILFSIHWIVKLFQQPDVITTSTLIAWPKITMNYDHCRRPRTSCRPIMPEPKAPPYGLRGCNVPRFIILLVWAPYN